MLALRSFARSAPRSVARLSATAARPQSALLSRTAAVCHPSWTQAAPRLAASFHLSAIRREDGSGNPELVAKLQHEISIEQDAKESDDLSANIRDYLENSSFEIEDQAGRQEVVLKRTYNGETIRVTFTTADLNNVGSEDEGLYDGEGDGEVDQIISDSQSGGANTKGSINQGKTSDGNVRVAPEDRIAPADREELDDEFDDGTEPESGFPARAHIRIERPGKGVLAIEATAQDGDFLIEELYHFPSTEVADPQTAEQEFQRRPLYSGPPFSNLDEDLQILLEKYLEERGINTRMALFIPDYIDHKEQKEYIRWLNNLKTFIE